MGISSDKIKSNLSALGKNKPWFYSVDRYERGKQNVR